MIKMTVKTDELASRVLEKTGSFADRKFMDDVGETIVTESKKAIKRGQSPIRKGGRFEKYSQSYEDAIKAGRYDGKGVRPVNLFLNGAFFKHFKWRAKGKSVLLGLINAPQNVREYMDLHNEGGTVKGRRYPKRQWLLEEGKSQQFIVSIQRILKRLYEKRLRDILNKL